MLKLSELSNKSHTINKYLVAILLLFIPLYPKFPLFAVPGSQVNIRLEDFILLGAFIIWFLVNLNRVRELLKSRIVLAIILFLAVGLISVICGALITDTVSPSVGMFHWIRRVQYLAPLFIGMTAYKSKADLRFYIKVIMVVVVFAFVYGAGQKFFNWPIITTQNQEYSRGIALFYVPGSHLVSTFAGHYDMAAFLVLVSPLFCLLMLSPNKLLKGLSITPSKWLSRIAYASLSFMSLWLLVNAASRISVAAYLGCVTLALMLGRKFKWIPVIIFVCLLFILTSSKLMDRYVQIFEVYVERMISTVEVSNVYAQVREADIPQRRNVPPPVTPAPVVVFEDRSTSIRLNVEWPRAIRAFQKNPLLGTGYSSITLATDNDYLRMLGEVGALGTLAFFLIFGRLFELFVKVIPKYDRNRLTDVFVIAIVSAIPGVMLNMVFIDILEASKFATIFWLLIGLCISILYKTNEKKIK